MAPLWSDSFQKTTSATALYDASNGGPTIQTSIVRTQTQAMRCPGSAAWVQKNFTSRDTYVLGMAFYIASFPTAGAEGGMMGVCDSSTLQWAVTVDSSGTLRVRRGPTLGGLSVGGTVLGTGSTLITSGTFHYLECKVKINSSTGTVDLYLDGLSILSLTGQNTQQTGNATGNQPTIGCLTNNGGDFYIDDYYVDDSTVYGDVSVTALFPSGNGTLDQYTNSFTQAWAASTVMFVGQTIKDSNGNVQIVSSVTGDDKTGSSPPTWSTTGGATTTDNHVTWTVLGSGSNPGVQDWMCVTGAPPNDNGSYVTDATVGHIERFVFPALSGSQIFTANWFCRAEKDDAGTRTIRAAGKSGGTTFDNGADFALTLNTYVYFIAPFATDPNTGVAWTVTGINAAEFGVKTTT